MKTTRAFYGKPAGLILFCSLLSSCYSYKPYLNDMQITSEILQENIVPGKRYEVLIIGEKKMTIKVDSVGSDRLIGDVTMLVTNDYSKNHQSYKPVGSQTTYHQKNFTLAFYQIKSVKEWKVSTGKTIAVIVIPISILVLIGINEVNNMNFGFSGI